MQDFLESFWEWFKEKTTGPLYATFAFCFVIENWQIFFTLFFQDNQFLGVPKVEYIRTNYFSGQGWWLLYDYAKVFLPPIIYTLVIVKYLPRAVTWAHKISVQHYFDRKNAYEDALLDFEGRKKTNLNKMADVKAQQASAVSRIVKSIPKEDLWEKEFNELRKELEQVRFSTAVQAIYDNDGAMYSMPTGFVAFGDVHGLIQFGREPGRISLSEKGKFFARKSLLNK